MKKKLYRTALFSSPLLALYGAVPAYVLERIEIGFFIPLVGYLSCFIFVIWSFNIALISRFYTVHSAKRYLLSYGIAFVLQAINLTIIEALEVKPPEVSLIYPLIGSIAINTMVLILANFIVLQFQKQSADKEIQQLKLTNLETQKQVLLQQLQPHFLFNALSTLKSLISENPASAEDYTVRLSGFLRYSMEAKDNEVISLAGELQFTKDYINLQKARFGQALQYTIDIQESLLGRKVPVYALQILVENSIKHNAFTEKNPLHLQIKDEGQRIKVENNRLPKALNPPSGKGLQNLNERYRILTGNEIEIIQDEDRFLVYINLLQP